MIDFKMSRRAVLGQIGALTTLGPALGQNLLPLAQTSVQADAVAGDVWSPSAIPETIVNAWLQDDLPEGRVSSHRARGLRAFDATQDRQERRPQKLANREGVLFEARAGQQLTFSYEEDAAALYRWVLIIFRVDGLSGTGPATLINVNEGSSAGNRVPWVRYRSDTRSLAVIYGASEYGRSSTVQIVHPDVVADGKTWNVHLHYRRNGRLFSRLNGAPEIIDEKTASLVFGRPPNENGGHMGDLAKDAPAWAYDSILIGQSELSEALADKLQAWAMWRVGRQADLPMGHLYRDRQPIVDAEDRPARFEFDADAWAAWTRVTGDKAAKFVNRGRPVPPEGDVVTVFRDDFRFDSVASHISGPSKNSIWFGTGWNTAVGVSAYMVRPDQNPDLYVHDPIAKTLTLSLAYDNGWKSAAMYTVNNVGQGRSWAKGIFEIRCKFPAYKIVPGGLKPAFWSYCLEALMWRTGERVEVDFFEPDGKNDMYMNGGSVHVHGGQIKGRFGNLDDDAQRVKVYAGELTFDTVGVDFHYWDGKFHTYTFRIDDDMTYMSIDGRELFRVPTSNELKQRIYLIANTALRIEDGEPDRAVRHDMVIDYVEVRQKRSQVEAFAPPFRARPVIRGETRPGQTLTVEHNLEGVRDISYDWYREGYPIVGTQGQTYVVTPSDSGAALRCLVRAVGARDQPEAWTDETSRVS